MTQSQSQETYSLPPSFESQISFASQEGSIIVQDPCAADLSSSATENSLSIEDGVNEGDLKDWTNEHFSKVYDPELNKFVRVCLAEGCKKQYSAGISTMTYKRHWKQCHQQEVAFKKTIFLFHDEIHISRLVKAFIFLHWDYRDLDKPEFHAMLDAYNPNKSRISRKTLSNIISNKRMILAEMVAERLKCVSSIAMTFDLWSDRRGSRGFGCITGHYINTDGNLVNLILAFKRIEYPHDATAIANFISITVASNKLEGKVVSITTDNASNNILAMTRLQHSLQLTLLTHVNMTLIHYKCCAHVLNLGVQAALDDLRDLVKDIRDTVLSIRKSGKRKEAFLKEQRKLIEDGIQQTTKPLELSEDIDHRWNSTYLLVERALTLKEAISLTFTATDSSLSREIDWETLYQVKMFLEPFYEATKMISVQNDSTISVVAFVMPRLIDHCSDYERCVCPAISGAAMSLREKLTKYESELYHPVANLAYVLDPRYKTTNLSRYMIDTTTADLRRLMDQFPKQSDPSLECSQSKSIFHRDVPIGEVDELDEYLKLPCERTHTRCLTWWRNNYHNYPRLWAAARSILNVQGTSVASERAFSIASEVDKPSRNHLADESVENIVLFKSWMEYLNLE